MIDSASDQAGAGADLRRARRRKPAEASRIDRLPPHSTEMEQGVLGCALLDPIVVVPRVVEFFRGNEEVFYDLRHRTIFAHLRQMADNDLNSIDVMTLQQRLKDFGFLEEIGGIPYLNSLQDAVPSAANIQYYADIVFEKYLLRKAVQVCTDAIGRIYDFEGDVNGALDELERDILKIRPTRGEKTPGIKALVHEAIERIEKVSAAAGSITGLPTGFVDLDKFTDGLHPGQMIVIAAFPSVGKTSIAMNIVEHVLLKEHKSVGVFTLEMTAVELVTRFICSHARVNLRNIRDGFISERDYPKITASAGKVANARVYFDDTSDLSIYQLRAAARRMKQEDPDLALFVIDYLQLLNAIGGHRKVENRQQEVADISNGIKQMAKELGVPVIVLSQLNDDGKLRESRAIGMDADGFWKLEEEEDSENDGMETDGKLIDLWIRKNRNGPRDIKIPLTFLAPYTRFESAAKVCDDDIPEQGDLPRE